MNSDILEKRLKGLKEAEGGLRHLFYELDAQSETYLDGRLTYPDLVHFMDDDRMRTQFRVLGIDPKDAWILFKLLDESREGSISIDQFVNGCMRLRGEAQRLDLHLMLQELMMEVEKLDKFMLHVVRSFEKLNPAGHKTEFMSERTRFNTGL